MKHCYWCDKAFEPKVRYQIYCSPPCREEATRFNIAEKYQIAKRKSKKPRHCKSCNALLSIYNDTTLCATCSINPIEVARALKEIRGLGNGKPGNDSE